MSIDFSDKNTYNIKQEMEIDKMIEKKYYDETKNLLEFIKKSPSSFHVIENIKEELLEHGYTELFEGESWEINKGEKYFVARNGSSIIGFNIPKNSFNSYMICASHSDFPSFKLKPDFEAETSSLYVKLNVEKYGGMIYSSWLDRPLSIAGRVITSTSTGIKSHLVNIDRDLCLIPSLAIHMNKDANSGYTYNPQKDLLPLTGSIDTKGALLKEIASDLNINETDILDYDIFLYNRTEGSIWGAESEYFSSPRIDDLGCVYASKKAFLETDNLDTLNILSVFDNEEVGSGTKQGAMSTFLTDTLERICDCLNIISSEFKQMTANSFILSADNGHALHPNFPEKNDITSFPVLNGGVLIKYNANQQYTTDAISGAIFKEILKKNDIPYQAYVNRSDIPGGSTLGNLLNRQLSLNSIDIGAPQLSMHSSYETGGVKDTAYLINAIKAFYDTKIIADKNGYKIV